MKRSRFSEEQIIAVLKEQEAAMPTADVCRRHGIWPLGNLEPGLDRPATQVLADRVARQTRPPLDLPDRHLIPKMPAPDNAQ